MNDPDWIRITATTSTQRRRHVLIDAAPAPALPPAYASRIATYQAAGLEIVAVEAPIVIRTTTTDRAGIEADRVAYGVSAGIDAATPAGAQLPIRLRVDVETIARSTPEAAIAEAAATVAIEYAGAPVPTGAGQFHTTQAIARQIAAMHGAHLDPKSQIRIPFSNTTHQGAIVVSARLYHPAGLDNMTRAEASNRPSIYARAWRAVNLRGTWAGPHQSRIHLLTEEPITVAIAGQPGAIVDRDLNYVYIRLEAGPARYIRVSLDDMRRLLYKAPALPPE